MTENNQSAANNVARSHPDEMTTAIVSAYVSNNSVPKGDLPDLISSVRAAITSGAAHPAIQAGPSHKASPADVRKSITPDALISFIDGKGYKTLKRHLGKHGLTPDTYRAKYGLPIDYPIVAPNYSKARSDLAKGYGLGSRNKAPTA